MSIAEIHPEELIDRALLDQLTERERAILKAHLAQCPACRFEQQARQDFADDLAAPTVTVTRKRPRIGRGRSLVWMVAAVFVVIAALASQRGRQAHEPLDPPAPPVSFAEPHTPRATATEATSPTTALEPVTRAPSVRSIATPPVRATVEEAVPEPPVEGAASMFARANDARRHGDHASAALVYRDLLARHPSADEAPIARLTLGRMLLGDGDGANALPLFEDYLALKDQALREEAFDGKARALGMLHQSDGERRAWEELLASYPQSVHADHARQRLQELRGH
jgi:TolA-binding protein